MATRKITHEESFPTTPERLFSALHTPSAICAWWRANRAIVVAKEGGIFAVAWGDLIDAPEYTTTATIKVFEAPKRMVLGDYAYFAKAGPLPFKAHFTTEYSVRSEDGAALLRIEQDGFPVEATADAFVAASEKGWRNTFAGIRQFLALTAGRPLVSTTAPLFVVSDLQRSVDFYAKKLGYIDPGMWGEPPCFAMLHRNGFDIMLSLAESPDRVRPNGPDGVWDMYIKVGDLEAEKAALEAAGVTLARPICKTEYGLLELDIVDPDGYRICIGQPVD